MPIYNAAVVKHLNTYMSSYAISVFNFIYFIVLFCIVLCSIANTEIQLLSLRCLRVHGRVGKCQLGHKSLWLHILDGESLLAASTFLKWVDIQESSRCWFATLHPDFISCFRACLSSVPGFNNHQSVVASINRTSPPYLVVGKRNKILTWDQV